MILTIQIIHTLTGIFLYGCLLFIIYAGWSRKRTKVLNYAFGFIVADGIVVTANGFICPFRTLVDRLTGDSSIPTMFVPSWMYGWLIELGAILLVIGLVLNLTLKKRYSNRQIVGNGKLNSGCPNPSEYVDT